MSNHKCGKCNGDGCGCSSSGSGCSCGSSSCDANSCIICEKTNTPHTKSHEFISNCLSSSTDTPDCSICTHRDQCLQLKEVLDKGLKEEESRLFNLLAQHLRDNQFSPLCVFNVLASMSVNAFKILRISMPDIPDSFLMSEISAHLEHQTQLDEVAKLAKAIKDGVVPMPSTPITPNKNYN